MVLAQVVLEILRKNCRGDHNGPPPILNRVKVVNVFLGIDYSRGRFIHYKEMLKKYSQEKLNNPINHTVFEQSNNIANFTSL